MAEQQKDKLMGLLVLGCETMRDGVIATGVFLLVGVLLLFVGTNVVPDFWYLQHIIIVIGFILVLLSPIILLSTFLLSVLPKSRKRLEDCNR